VEIGVLAPEEPGRISPGDVRRVLMARSLEDAGIPLDGVGAAIRSGALSLDFLDATAFERLAAMSPETFQQASDRTGIPFELPEVVREAIGMAPPSPDDRLREVLVSQAVADASTEAGIGFEDIGPVELKGVTTLTHLLRAHLV
jgi:hypothetical protein